ncbi:MAG: hypothetical protein ABW321_09925 [Polyangiales bacterium]
MRQRAGRSRHWTFVFAGWLGCAWAAAAVALPAPALAREYRLGVLQIESDDMQDDLFAPAFMQELHDVLGQRRDVTAIDTHVSLSQLSMGQGCSTTDASCLLSIAKTLKVDGFVFGKLAREGGAPVAILRRYDTQSAAIRGSALVSFDQTDQAHLHIEVVKLVDVLLGQQTDPEPQLAAAPPAATEPVAEPEAAADGGPGFAWRAFGGYTLLGAAAVSVGLSVFSFVQIDRAEKDPSFDAYRVAVGEQNTTVQDVCDEADANKNYGLSAQAFQNARSACNKGATFEVLQYVFLGAAVLTGGLGTFLLLGGDGDQQDDSATARLRLRPSVGRNQVALVADLRF